VVSFGVGGVADLTVRIVAQQLGQSLGQAVVIDNKPGASCWVASDAVAKAASGGHTLLLMSNATAVNAGLFKSLSFNSNCAFAPIATLGCFDITLIIKASSHFKTLAKLLAYAHVHPRLLNLGMIKVTNTQNLTSTNTPTQVIALLNTVIVSAINHPEVRLKLPEMNVQARARTPDQATKLLASDTKRWGEVITSATIPC
jgi:tripartite-type tricarboxylate transporter receptor subunit TctC